MMALWFDLPKFFSTGSNHEFKQLDFNPAAYIYIYMLYLLLFIFINN